MFFFYKSVSQRKAPERWGGGAGDVAMCQGWCPALRLCAARAPGACRGPRRLPGCVPRAPACPRVRAAVPACPRARRVVPDPCASLSSAGVRAFNKRKRVSDTIPRVRREK